jgi:hypothetical protein
MFYLRCNPVQMPDVYPALNNDDEDHPELVEGLE